MVTVGVRQCGHTSGFLWLSRSLVLSLCLVSCCLSVLSPVLHLLIPSACYLHLQLSLLLPHPQLHGRSREQRYTRLADWPYIEQCAKVASPMPLFGRYLEPLGLHLSTGKIGRMLGPLEISRLIDDAPHVHGACHCQDPSVSPQEMGTSFRLRTPTVPCRQALRGSWLPGEQQLGWGSSARTLCTPMRARPGC